MPDYFGDWIRKLECRRWQRRLCKSECRGELLGGKRIVVAGDLLDVIYLDTGGACQSCKRWIVFTAYCFAKQGGYIRSPRSTGEYQAQYVVSAEGNTKAGAWYEFVGAMYQVVASHVDRDQRFKDAPRFGT